MSDSKHPMKRLWARLKRYASIGAEKAIRIPVAVVISALVSRSLGIEAFGLYSSLLALVTIFVPLASFGTESLGVAMAARSENTATFLGSVGTFRLATGILAALSFIAIVSAFFGSAVAEIDFPALVVLSSVLILRGYEVFEYELLARENINEIARTRLVAYLFSSAVMLIALHTGAGLPLILALVTLEPALLLLWFGIRFRADWPRVRAGSTSWREKLPAFRAQARESMPVFASGVIVLIMLNVDRLMVYRFLGAEDAGLYSSAAKLVEVLFFIPLVIGSVYAASLARLSADAGFFSTYRTALQEGTLLSTVAAILLAAFSGPILSLIFGPQFAPAASALAWLSPTIIAVTWVSLRTRALAALDMRWDLLKMSALAFVVHLPLLMFGISLGSIEAVAASQSAGWLIAALLVPRFVSDALAFSPINALRNSP